MTQQEAHERLVNEIDLIVLSGHAYRAQKILLLILSRLGEEAYETAQRVFADGDDPGYTEDFLEMLEASPLQSGTQL